MSWLCLAIIGAFHEPTTGWLGGGGKQQVIAFHEYSGVCVWDGCLKGVTFHEWAVGKFNRGLRSTIVVVRGGGDGSPVVGWQMHKRQLGHYLNYTKLKRSLWAARAGCKWAGSLLALVRPGE